MNPICLCQGKKSNFSQIIKRKHDIEEAIKSKWKPENGLFFLDIQLHFSYI
jgi:hypothetical protein